MSPAAAARRAWRRPESRCSCTDSRRTYRRHALAQRSQHVPAFAGVFVSIDGSAFGTRSPGYVGFLGPQLERWVEEEQERRLMVFPLVISETGQQPVFQEVGDFQLALNHQTVFDERLVLLDDTPGGPPPYTP